MTRRAANLNLLLIYLRPQKLAVCFTSPEQKRASGPAGVAAVSFGRVPTACHLSRNGRQSAPRHRVRHASHSVLHPPSGLPRPRETHCKYPHQRPVRSGRGRRWTAGRGARARSDPVNGAPPYTPVWLITLPHVPPARAAFHSPAQPPPAPAPCLRHYVASSTLEARGRGCALVGPASGKVVRSSCKGFRWKRLAGKGLGRYSSFTGMDTVLMGRTSARHIGSRRDCGPLWLISCKEKAGLMRSSVDQSGDCEIGDCSAC